MPDEKELHITFYPFAFQDAFLFIPKADLPSLRNADEIKEYVREHWEDIEFYDPELDYAGTDFDVEFTEEKGE